jgi:hypothetical protein
LLGAEQIDEDGKAVLYLVDFCSCPVRAISEHQTSPCHVSWTGHNFFLQIFEYVPQDLKKFMGTESKSKQHLPLKRELLKVRNSIEARQDA